MGREECGSEQHPEDHTLGISADIDSPSLEGGLDSIAHQISASSP